MPKRVVLQEHTGFVNARVSVALGYDGRLLRSHSGMNTNEGIQGSNDKVDAEGRGCRGRGEHVHSQVSWLTVRGVWPITKKKKDSHPVFVIPVLEYYKMPRSPL